MKIAVLGLTTDDTVRIGNPANFLDTEFRKPADEAKKVVEELRTTRKNPILLLSLLPIRGIMTMVIMALMHRVMLKWRVLCRKAI